VIAALDGATLARHSQPLPRKDNCYVSYWFRNKLVPLVGGGLLLALSSALPARAASFPPELQFRSLSTPRVTVHYHQGLEALAREAAALATEILEAHERRYGRRVGRVQIVLVDVEDDPNGCGPAGQRRLRELRGLAALRPDPRAGPHRPPGRGPRPARGGAQGLRPRAVPFPQRLHSDLDGGGPGHGRGDGSHLFRPRTQPGRADGVAHGRAGGWLLEGGPGGGRARPLARGAGFVPLRRGLPRRPERAAGAADPARAGAGPRGPGHPLPRRPHGQEGHGEVLPCALARMDGAHPRRVRAGSGADRGPRLDPVAGLDRPGHPAGGRALQPRRRAHRVHQPHADAAPRAARHDPRRPRGPEGHGSQRGDLAVVDARRPHPRLRRERAAPDLLRAVGPARGGGGHGPGAAADPGSPREGAGRLARRPHDRVRVAEGRPQRAGPRGPGRLAAARRRGRSGAGRASARAAMPSPPRAGRAEAGSTSSASIPGTARSSS